MIAFTSARAARAALVFVPFLAAACGSAGSGGGAETPLPDAAAGPMDAPSASSAPDAPTAAPPDASTVPPAFVSNVPGATVIDVGAPPTPGLVLLSLNFLQSPSGGQYYQEWLGEVENVGTAPVCNVHIDVTYQDGTGAAVVTVNTSYIDADPYSLSGDVLSVPCIPPGKIGSFWSNAFANTMTSTSSVKTIAVKFGSLTEPGVLPDPNAPLVSAQVESTGLGYVVSGTIGAAPGAASISNIAVRIFPRDALGLVLAEDSATDLGTLAPGGSYPFSTTGISTPFTEHRDYADYAEGVSSGYPKVGDPVVDRVARALVPRRAAEAENLARAALARSRR